MWLKALKHGHHVRQGVGEATYFFKPTVKLKKKKQGRMHYFFSRLHLFVLIAIPVQLVSLSLLTKGINKEMGQSWLAEVHQSWHQHSVMVTNSHFTLHLHPHILKLIQRIWGFSTDFSVFLKNTLHILWHLDHHILYSTVLTFTVGVIKFSICGYPLLSRITIRLYPALIHSAQFVA